MSLDLKQIVHIASEVIVIIAVTLYFNQKINSVQNKYTELKERVEAQQKIIERQEQMIYQQAQMIWTELRESEEFLISDLPAFP